MIRKGRSNDIQGSQDARGRYISPLFPLVLRHVRHRSSNHRRSSSSSSASTNTGPNRAGVLIQPLGLEVGAGNSIRHIPGARSAPSRGMPTSRSPAAARPMAAMASIPNRLQRYYQYQVVMKLNRTTSSNCNFESEGSASIRWCTTCALVEDNRESPTSPGALAGKSG